MKVHVFITLKPAVLDPQGKAVQKALHRLGYNETQDVRVGRFLELTLEEKDRDRATERVKEMCERLLANPVIENARYEFAV